MLIKIEIFCFWIFKSNIFAFKSTDLKFLDSEYYHDFQNLKNVNITDVWLHQIYGRQKLNSNCLIARKSRKNRQKGREQLLIALLLTKFPTNLKKTQFLKKESIFSKTSKKLPAPPAPKKFPPGGRGVENPKGASWGA